MEQQLKASNFKFSLLYLDYTEYLFNSIKAYAHYPTNFSRNIEKGNLHINSNSIFFDSDDISTPLLKLKFGDNFHFKSYSLDDLVNISVEYLQGDIINKEHNSYREININEHSNKNSKKNLNDNLSFNNNSYREIIKENNSKEINYNSSKKKSVMPVIKKNNERDKKYHNNMNILPMIEIFEFDKTLSSAMTACASNQVPVFHNISSSIFENSRRTAKKRNSNLNDSLTINHHSPHFLELHAYFNENNLNIYLFTEIFNNIYKSYADYSFINTYSVLLIKTKYRKIPRNCIDKYEEVIPVKTFLFVLEGKNEEIKKLLNDIFVFTEGLKNHDESTLVGMVTTRKLEELKQNYEEVDLNIEEEPAKMAAHDKEDTYTKSSKIQIIYQSNVTRILPEKNQSGLLVIHYKKSQEFNNDIMPLNTNNSLIRNILSRKNSTVLNASSVIQENLSNENLPQTNHDFSQTLLEFIPVNNNHKNKTLKFKINDIKAIVKYRFLFQYKAINIFFYSKKRSVILDFDSEVECKIIMNFLSENSPKLDKSFNDIKYHTNMWVDNQMSNYDYLMYLNTEGGRSFNDLSQYPIMPWVISNYEDENLDLVFQKNFRDLTKPIGALNEKRLSRLKENYLELKEQGKENPYLYGTYYSFPYITFYYLIRTHPSYFLRFQEGNFGPTDRLFISIQECWKSCIRNPSSQDFKELIPEFYNSEGDFMKNSHGLKFGKTQSNEVVEDVILPKWAKSPKNFVSVMRNALESDYVSNNLHNWIDLIFGFKQRGEKALEADNLYHHLRYDFLPVDGEDRQGDIDNIFEFGQAPIQLFVNEPHPKKRSRITLNEIISNDLSEDNEFLIKISRLKKERMNIEKRYEKERRQKDDEIEELQLKLVEKEKEFCIQALLIKETIKNKESEFAAYFSVLVEQNMKLKENFSFYDINKDKVYDKWISEVRDRHDTEIQSLFSDKINVYKSIRELENIVDKNKTREINYINKTQELESLLLQKEKEEKILKEEYYNLRKLIRNLPPQQQIYVNKMKNVSDSEQKNIQDVNLRKIIRNLK